MFRKLALTVLAAGLAFGPRPARAAGMLDSTNAAAIEAAGGGQEMTALDKGKPSRPEKEEKESKKKKKYDDFRDKNGNGIDDRFEKKEPPKKRKKGEPGEEANF